MTAPANPPEHCEHECVCGRYLNPPMHGVHPEGSPCPDALAKSCRHDTRAKPELPNFAKAKVGDWYQGVGFITTIYEQDFVRRFGGALDAQQPPSPADALENLTHIQSELWWIHGRVHQTTVENKAMRGDLTSALRHLTKLDGYITEIITTIRNQQEAQQR